MRLGWVFSAVYASAKILQQFLTECELLGGKKLVSFDTELLMQDTESVTEGEITAKITGSVNMISSCWLPTESWPTRSRPSYARTT